MKNILAIVCVTAFLSLGGCKLVNADGECFGICGPICNNIGTTCDM